MRYLLIFLFPCLITIVNAQGVKFNKAYGNNGFDSGRNIIQGPNDHYYIVGSTSSSTGNTDVLVFCIDENGDELWAQYYGTDQIDIGTDIVLTADNNLIVLGYTNGAGLGGYDCYLAKISLTGSIIWEKTIGGEDWDFGYDIQMHDSGNLYILGETYSFGNGNNDVYLIQINNNGDVIWEKTYGTVGNELGRNMTIADNGDLIIIGDQKLEDANSSSAWMLRIDDEGNEIWEFVHNLYDDIDEFGQDVIFDNGHFIAMSNYPDNVEAPYTSFWRMGNDLVIDWEKNASNQVFYGLLRKNDVSFVLLGRDLIDDAQWFYWGLSDGFPDAANGGPQAFDVNFGYESFYNGINTSDQGFICVGEADIDGEGQYSVLVTKFDSLLITFQEIELNELPLSVQEFNLADDITLYPNPVKNVFRIDYSRSYRHLHYVIKSATGEDISSGSLKERNVNVRSLSDGMYIVEIYEEDQLISVKKFVKEK